MAEPMSVEALSALPDDRLDSVIYDRLIAKMDDWDNQREVVDKWSEPERVCFVVNATAGEVMNGGFNQFFYNSAGRQFFEIAAQCLQTAGADQWADIVQRACEIIDSDEGDKIVESWGDTLESFSQSYKDNPLNALDDEFYALDEKQFIANMLAYMKANLASFADA
ncbi:MAG: DMP19 family protein [Propionibacteriaceae bacterium]|nr:DMP19 family protein [Propionibacteriaceae bacterium]